MKMSAMGWITFVLVIIGALNWGLVGFFEWDLVKAIFGEMTTASRVVYDLVGLAALWMIVSAMMKSSEE